METNQLVTVRQALWAVARAVRAIRSPLRADTTEQDLAWWLRRYLTGLGYFRPAFDYIVAAGKNAAEPHHVPTNRKLKRGDMVVIDFGVRVAGTATDLTRTFFIGPPSAKQRQLYNHILKAQELGIRVVRAEMKAGDIDAVCRNYFATHLLAKYFTHGTGHGIGWRIHQKPSLKPGSADILRVGDIITIEPGLYIKNWGGIRIEDMVLVTEHGGKVLTGGIPKALEEMVVRA